MTGQRDNTPDGINVRMMTVRMETLFPSLIYEPKGEREWSLDFHKIVSTVGMSRTMQLWSDLQCRNSFRPSSVEPFLVWIVRIDFVVGLVGFSPPGQYGVSFVVVVEVSVPDNKVPVKDGWISMLLKLGEYDGTEERREMAVDKIVITLIQFEWSQCKLRTEQYRTPLEVLVSVDRKSLFIETGRFYLRFRSVLRTDQL